MIGLVLALIGFAVFSACIPSCNMPIMHRDVPRGPQADPAFELVNPPERGRRQEPAAPPLPEVQP
jgi:hypothetical protein